MSVSKAKVHAKAPGSKRTYCGLKAAKPGASPDVRPYCVVVDRNAHPVDRGRAVGDVTCLVCKEEIA